MLGIHYLPKAGNLTSCQAVYNERDPYNNFILINDFNSLKCYILYSSKEYLIFNVQTILSFAKFKSFKIAKWETLSRNKYNA